MAYQTTDDADPNVEYSPGWQAFTTGGTFDGTKHGATDAGMTATFRFTGTQIIVGGPLGSIDVHGMPSSLYSIDGSDLGGYTAPIVKPGTFFPNITYFTSPMLSGGEHTLVITNMNGTRPNVYWLDWIAVLSSVDVEPTSPRPPPPTTNPPSNSPTSPTFPTTQSATTSISSPKVTMGGSTSGSSRASSSDSISNESLSPASETTSVIAGVPTDSFTTSLSASNVGATETLSVSTISNTKANLGAIIGGAVGGLGVLILAALFLMWYLKRRRAARPATISTEDVRPFATWRDTDAFPSPPSKSGSRYATPPDIDSADPFGSSGATASTSTPDNSGNVTLNAGTSALTSARTSVVSPAAIEGASAGAYQADTSATPTSLSRSSRGQSIMRFIRGPRLSDPPSPSYPEMRQAVDSGVRLTGEGTLPPPYTPE